MLDSLNYSILGIFPQYIIKFKERFRRCHSNYVYTFSYKSVHFNYYLLHRTLTLTTHTQRILKRLDVTENDVDEYLQKLISIIKEVVNLKVIKLNLTRCDYCIDVPVSSNEELQEIFNLLNKHHSRFKYITANQIYENSRYLCKPNSSVNINIYDKFSQILNVYGYEDERYRNIIRVELQLKKNKIKKLYNRDNLQRDVKNYWCKETMQREYFKYLQDYLYLGDYYKLSIAESKINSSSYSKTIKKNLINCIKKINSKGITTVTKNMSYNTTQKYTMLLTNLNLNPITISNNSKFDYIQNILVRVIDIADKTKFNNETDKK